MASLIPNILPKDSHNQILITGASIALLIGIVFVATFGANKKPKNDDELSTWSSFIRFFYACFLKPHEKHGENGQQDALESFYKAQAGVYDATRKRLLCGREDMLGLVAAQLVHKAASGQLKNQRRIWVDVSIAASLS
jgi:betaine lipid synthase